MEYPIKDLTTDTHKNAVQRWKIERRLEYIVLVFLAVIAGTIAIVARWYLLSAFPEWDIADYAYAADYGLFRNWILDYELNRGARHWHSPMHVYFLSVCYLIFGRHTWVIHIPDLMSGAIASVVALCAVFDLCRAWRWVRLLGGLLLAIILAVTPSINMMTGPHGFTLIFIILHFWFLSRLAERGTRFWAILLGCSFGGQFVSMEYGWPMLLGCMFILMLARPDLYGLKKKFWQSRPKPVVGWVFLSCFLTVLILWPGGLIYGSVVLNFAYYVRYSMQGHQVFFDGAWHQHAPVTAYVQWYWELYPVMLIGWFLFILGTAISGIRLLPGRYPASWVMIGLMLLLIVMAHRAHIMSLMYSAYMVAGIAMTGIVHLIWMSCSIKERQVPIREWFQKWWKPEQPVEIKPAHVWTSSAIAIVLCLCGALPVLNDGVFWSTWVKGSNNRILSKELKPHINALPEHAVIMSPNVPVTRYIAHFEADRRDIRMVWLNPAHENPEAQIDSLQHREHQLILIPPSMLRRYPDNPTFYWIKRNYREVDRIETYGGDFLLFEPMHVKE